MNAAYACTRSGSPYNVIHSASLYTCVAIHFEVVPARLLHTLQVCCWAQNCSHSPKQIHNSDHTYQLTNFHLGTLNTSLGLRLISPLRLRVTVCNCACAARACGLQSTVKCVRDFGVSFLSLNLHLSVYQTGFQFYEERGRAARKVLPR